MYDRLVESEEQTCFGCPSQWEGRLKNGLDFYFRYRWGMASLTICDRTESKVVGDSMSGVMSVEQYKEIFVGLYRAMLA